MTRKNSTTNYYYYVREKNNRVKMNHVFPSKTRKYYVLRTTVVEKEKKKTCWIFFWEEENKNLYILYLEVEVNLYTHTINIYKPTKNDNINSKNSHPRMYVLVCMSFDVIVLHFILFFSPPASPNKQTKETTTKETTTKNLNCVFRTTRQLTYS